MKNIIRRGINSNMLKTIAIMAMVIDHIGFYFQPIISTSIYNVCRYIGRISMPIFVYLLVQGFFHTKNFKKYIARISIFAIITQILITILMFINIKFIPSYIAANQVYTTGNILFSFAICLIALKILHEEVIVKKWEYNKNLSLKIVLIISIFLASIFIPIDYGIEVFVLSIILYYIEKLKIQIYLNRDNINNPIKNVFSNIISEEKIKIIYVLLILGALIIIVAYFNAYWTLLLAIIPIALYNGERGKINMKYIYYIIFPLQHTLLYLGALLIMLT